ncbi:hypothetical protein [Streptomyces sp. NPDC046332]|uniref:hypothetical protein n=1 Tax=Streptomyces sp. NPDC046332 TaxID=3155133 RepID=UPI0033CD3AAE
MRWERPAAGREPAAAALLGWLADPQAPRLCLVSGSEGCGKSQLLAWLVHHGSQSGVPAERAVHAVVSFAGQSLRGTVWSIADQLGVVARAPGELAVALGRDPRRTVIVLPDLHDEDVTGLALDLVRLPHVRLLVESRSGSPAHRVLSHADCAELDLDLAQWRDQRRFEQWRAAQPDDRTTASPATVETPLDLSDPVAVCEADPWEVTSAYDRSDDDHGGLRAAWLRAGQSLCREQPPASRSLVLLGLLGDSADPRVAPELREVAAGADWGVEWSRVRGDLTPPWPGPVTTLAVGKGSLADCLVAVGPDGTVKAVRMADAGARGRLPHNRSRPVAMAVMTDGTVLMLDEHGRVEAESGWAALPAGAGLAGLLDEGPTSAQRLLDSLEGHSSTALAHAAGDDLGIVALGDATGTVRIFGDATDSARLHEGRVNALAALSVPLDGDVTVPLIYSGGADGTVRAWSPGRAPMTAPILQRACPVVSLDATFTRNGPATVVAWGDGTVECVHWDTGGQQTFRPGPPVRAVALAADSRVLVGMDEALICLVPKTTTGDGGIA